MFIRSGYRAHTLNVWSATEHHHHAADVVGSGLHRHSARGPQPGRARLPLESGGGEPVQTDHVAGGGSLTAPPDDLAYALEHEPVLLLADRDRLARVHDAVELPHVGSRKRPSLVAVEQLEHLCDRDRHHSVGAAEVPLRATQELAAALGSAQ